MEQNSTSIQREHIAENMKERIYSTLTLVALLAAHLQVNEQSSVRGLIVTIIAGVGAIWAATLISSRISYRAIHGKSIDSSEYSKIFFTSSGLLAPAVMPIIVILGSLTHAFSLRTAVMISIAGLLLSIFLLSLVSARKIYTSKWRLISVSLVEMSVGLGIVVLKLLGGE